MTKEALENLSLDLGSKLTKSNKALALAEIADFDDDEAKKLIESMNLKEPLNGRFLSIWLGCLGAGRFYKGDKKYAKTILAIHIGVASLAFIIQILLGNNFATIALMLLLIAFILYFHYIDSQLVLTGIFKDNMQKFMTTIEYYKANKGGKNE